jgi:hypothetical protein
MIGFKISDLRFQILISCILGVIAFGQGEQILQDGSAYSIASPYAAADLFEVQYIQSANVMYLAHPDYHPQILQRFGDTNWTIADVNFVRGPFMAQNTSVGWTLTPSATTGDITITASLDTFYAEHVGALWQLSHTVDANTVTGSFTADSLYVAQADQNSPTLLVAMGQDFSVLTSSRWKGILYLQRSYDGTNWQDVYTFTSTSDNPQNMDFRDTETVADAEYRLKMTDQYGVYVHRDEQYFSCSYTMVAANYVKQGIVSITGVSTPRLANATVLYDLGGTIATYLWAEGSWSNYRGWPAAVTLHRERLCFGGTAAEPDTIWFSQTDDWHNFLVTNLETSAYTCTLAADQVNTIRWLVSHNDMMIGTTGDEWKLETPAGKPLSASTLNRQSTYGSAEIQGLLVNNQVIYAQRNNEKIMRLKFDFASDNWRSEDLTLLSEHITDTGITQLAYQRSPLSILWSVCDNGELLALVLEDNQEILGWSRYVFDGDCESVAVVSGDPEDEVWVIIKREIGGSEKRYIEQFQPIEFADQDSAFFVDCGLSFDGGAAVSITNITQANPAVVTAADHTFADGDQVRFAGVGGMDEVNYQVYTVHTVTGSSFELRDLSDAVDINSVTFTAYTSGGTVEQVENTFTTLDHLEDKAVVAAGDGGYAGDYTVDANTVTLDDYYNRVHIGLPYTAKLEPMKLEFLTTGGALQGRTKRISATTLRFFESLSCSIGPTWTDYDSYVFRDNSDAMEAATPLFTGDKKISFTGGFETAGDMCIQDSYPVPLTVLGIIVDYEVEK